MPGEAFARVFFFLPIVSGHIASVIPDSSQPVNDAISLASYCTVIIFILSAA